MCSSDLKTLAAALTKSISKLTALRQVATEVLGADKASKLDPLTPISKALQAYLEARRGQSAPKTWQEFLDANQGQFAGMGENVLDETSQKVFQPIYEFRDSSEKLSKYLNNFVSELEGRIYDLKNFGGTDIFGETIPIESQFDGTIQSEIGRAHV